jgi:hypothetical protein
MIVSTEVNRMASDEEKKWEQMSDVYCLLLEEAAKHIRTMKPSIPDEATRAQIVGKIKMINGLGEQLPRYMMVKSKYGF